MTQAIEITHRHNQRRDLLSKLYVRSRASERVWQEVRGYIGENAGWSPQAIQAIQSTLKPTKQVPKYPESLMSEYRTLTSKHLMTGLNMQETTRLKELKDQIAAIDLADPMMQVRQTALDQLRCEIEQLRREVDALPDKQAEE